jgi:hypothetical protein
MPTQPSDTSPSDQRNAEHVSTQRGPDRAQADTVTESQSAYLRGQHRQDAEPGDASADEREVRVQSNYETRRGDTTSPQDQGAGQACQSAFTRAEERTSPTRNPEATR